MSIVTLIVYGVLAAAAFAAIHAFDLSRQKIGSDAQLAADTPIINACKADRDTAVKANASLQTDVTRIAGERDRQSQAVKELSDAMEAQAKAKIVRQAATKPRIDALRAESGTLEQRLAMNTEGRTCDEKLANVDRDLRAIVGGGVRDVGTAPATSDGRSANPPARPHSGKGTLRLSQ